MHHGQTASPCKSLHFEKFSHQEPSSPSQRKPWPNRFIFNNSTGDAIYEWMEDGWIGIFGVDLSRFHELETKKVKQR